MNIEDICTDFINDLPSITIIDGAWRTFRFIAQYDDIHCSVSGGSDSDCMIDILCRMDKKRKIVYDFFDTKIEMQATKKHLDELETKYGIKINRFDAIKSVPVACSHYGIPFLSKKISEYIYRLQIHNFNFIDGTFEELYEKYPNCKAALRWWCNAFGEKSRMNIERNKLLKEFMIQNPPQFLISPRCCDYAKKKTADKYGKCELQLVGIRKSEGGARSTTYTTCFADGKHGKQHFPLFWWDDAQKQYYKEWAGIKYSDAYEVYGCKRTGCAGCPFGSGFEDELSMLKQFEPNLYKACNNIFGKSYNYMRQYRDFKKGK